MEEIRSIICRWEIKGKREAFGERNQVPESPDRRFPERGQKRGKIFKKSYRAESGVKKGSYELAFKVYGNRKNTFGQLHNCSNTQTWCGPDAWRTLGEKIGPMSTSLRKPEFWQLSPHAEIVEEQE